MVDIVITVTEAYRNPYFNMVRKNNNGTVGLVNPPESLINRRQDAPELFDMATVCYVANPKFVLENEGLFNGRVGSVLIPRQRAVDIDTLYDFRVAENLFMMRGSYGDTI